MFQHTRDVPEQWERELAALFPRSERVTWMKLAWMPGWNLGPDFEVQRWCVFEMVPMDWMDDLRKDALRGADPRTDGQWVSDPRVPQHLGGRKWRSNSPVSHQQWALYRETGYAPIRRWIIQGEAGGHPAELSDVEMGFRKMVFGEGYDLPRPGDLPYADWSQKVAQKLAEHDKLRQWERRMQTPWTDRNMNKTEAGIWVGRDEHDLEKKYAELCLKMLDSEIEDVCRDIPRGMLPAWSDMPIDPGAVPTVEQREALDEHLTTNTTHKPYT